MIQNENKTIIIYADGGARGNPGPSALGAVLYLKTRDGKLKKLAEISTFLGEMTNNQAEYSAVIAALDKAKGFGATNVECYLDSELIVNQLNLKFKVKNKELAHLFVEAWRLVQSFKKCKFMHIPREQNKEADRLVNRALNRAQAGNF